jgi:hypothetical protein
MKCTNQVQVYDRTIAYFHSPPNIDCNGEMIKTCEIKNGTGEDTGLSTYKLYQCEQCKIMKIC